MQAKIIALCIMLYGSHLYATRPTCRDIWCFMPVISTVAGTCGGIAVAALIGTTIIRDPVVIAFVPVGAVIGYSAGLIAEIVRLNKMRSEIERDIALL